MSKTEKTFGLCLSGGGFRATLFHLGVIKYLHDAGLLDKVTHIFSVSGGSILAAHLVLNWEKYNGTDDEFEEMASEVCKFAQSDLRGRVIRAWILSWLWIVVRPFCRFFRRFRLRRFRSLIGCNWKTSGFLEEAYAKFYKNKTLEDIDKAELPQLHILSTSLTTGRLFSFKNSGVAYIGDDEDDIDNLIPTAILPISKAVAASSAFPPIFSPVAISSEMLNVKVEEFPFGTEYLADGGVYDNLGIRKLLLIQKIKEFKFDEILLSDAGSGFSSKPDNPFSFVLSLSIRASDLLMRRVGILEYLELGKIKSIGDAKISVCNIFVGPNERIQNHKLNTDTQRSLWEIRTDLNAFSPWEINALTQHGFAVARDSFGRPGDDTSQFKNSTWMPAATRDLWGEYKLPDEKEKFTRRTWNLLSFKDFRSYLSVGLLVIYALIPINIFTDWADFKLDGVRAKRDESVDTFKRVLPEFNQVMELLRSGDSDKIDEAKKKVTEIQGQIANTLANVDVNESDKFLNQTNNLAVVKIIGGNGSIASGFFVSGDGYILTADYSVKSGETEFTINLSDGTSQHAKLKKIDPVRKLALLKIDRAEGKFEFFHFNVKRVEAKSRISAKGIIDGTEVRSVTGEIVGWDNSKQFLQIKLNQDRSVGSGFAGMVGGAVIDLGVKVIGVFYSSNNTQIANCIPADQAVAFLVENHVIQNPPASN